jgi:hypothetical protein
MVKNLGLSLDPPLPLVNVAPIIFGPTLFQDNLCRHCDAFKLFDSLWILWYRHRPFGKVLVDFGERLSNSSFQGVTPHKRARSKGTKTTKPEGKKHRNKNHQHKKSFRNGVSRWP